MTTYAADRINLLPPSVAAKRRARKLAAAGVLAGLAFMVATGLVWVRLELRIGDVERSTSAQLAENSTVQAEVQRYAHLENAQLDIAASQRLLDTLFADEVRWSMVLTDVQAVLPSDAWLTGLSGIVAPGEAGIGRIDFTGTTFTHPDVADVMLRLLRIPGATDPYFTVSTKAEMGGREVVHFTGSVTLTPDAYRPKAMQRR